jgi:hypothetical protein
MIVRKNVTDDVFERIVSAMRRIEGDPQLRRTKRQIEQISGLSHDAVARAFRQDAESDGKPWGINDRYERLAGQHVATRSPHEQEVHALKQEIAAKTSAIRDLNATLDAYATALFAYSLNEERRQAGTSDDPVPIGRNRLRD